MSRIQHLRHMSDRELLEAIHLRQETMLQQISTLKSDVAANANAEAAAMKLLSTLSDELKAALSAQADGDDGAALADLSAQLEANTAALAAAVVANTPAAPVPAPDAPPATA